MQFILIKSQIRANSQLGIYATFHYALASHADFAPSVLGERSTCVRVDKLDFQIWKHKPNGVFLRNSMALFWITVGESDAAMLRHSVCLAAAKKGILTPSG